MTAEPRSDHAGYIGHWLRILKADRKAIFAAASAANKAAEFLDFVGHGGAIIAVIALATVFHRRGYLYWWG